MPHPEAPAAAPLAETAYAKINLALHVRGRRDDGYHELESLFVFAEDGDRLSAVTNAGGTLGLTIDGPFAGSLAADDDNLVLRAARALREASGVSQGAQLHLTKSLPVASGIGGGSADAAAALRLLARLWRIDLPAARMEAIALSLGSDVPACLSSRMLFVGGRGDRLQPAAVPGLAGMAMLLVNPGVGLTTGPVFAGWDKIDRGPLAADRLGALAEARNDLQTPAIALVPAIANVLAALAAQPGVMLSRMSGSGATCFAQFDTDEARDRAARTLRSAQPDWWIMETRVRST